jgi:long-chain acyl-CoA synthetase
MIWDLYRSFPEPADGYYPPHVPRNLDYPKFPADGLLDRAAQLLPDHIACQYMDRTWSYRQLQIDATRLARWLQDHGIRPRDRVGVLLPNIPEYLVALNGIWKAGGVVVSISPLSVAEEVSSLLKLTDCRCVISLDVLSSLLPAHQIKTALWVSLRNHLPVWKHPGYLWALWQRTGHLWMETDPQHAWFWPAIHDVDHAPTAFPSDSTTEPAYILSTGGTTGQAKAITLSHRNLVANAWQQMYWAGATFGKEKMLAVLPFFHCYGLSTMVTGGAALGATLVMHHRYSTAKALQLIRTERPTVFHAVPAMLVDMNRQLRQKAMDLGSLKWVISGGAPLPPDVAREFSEHSGALVVEGYGLSEASPVTHVGPLDERNRLGFIGIPLPDTECLIVDPDDVTPSHETQVPKGTSEKPLPLATGEVGELIVRGPQVMLGYWKNPEATCRTIRDGWLFTGDLGYRDTDGFFRIVDRKKDLIITSGFNVYPTEVEQVLRTIPGVRDCAVVGIPDEQRGEIVKAYVLMEESAEFDEEVLRAFAHEHLGAHKRPKLYEHVQGDLPRNFLGKVLRRELRSR